MNDVRLHVPYIFGNKQNSKRRKKEKRAEKDRERSEEKQKEERPAVGQEKQERGKAKAR